MNFFKKFSLALCIWFIAMDIVVSQQFITFPIGTPPGIDGVLKVMEWNDAASIDIRINANETVKVFYKASSDTMYFAFIGRLESGNIRFPEICLDTRNDKTFFWDADDWWFHISATDCDHNGAPGVYTNCALVQDDWLAMPNIIQGLPVTDSIEIAIPFSKVNLSSKDTFGIAFNVTNTFSTWNFWPGEATLNQPSTWATACFSQITSGGIQPIRAEEGIAIYPNPNNGIFTISSSNSFSDVRLYDKLGKMVTSINHQERVNSISVELNTLNLQSGTYLICIDKAMRSVCILN